MKKVKMLLLGLVMMSVVCLAVAFNFQKSQPTAEEDGMVPDSPPKTVQLQQVGTPGKFLAEEDGMVPDSPTKDGTTA